MNWLDKGIATVAPAWALKRKRARVAADLLERHYEAATVGRRTEGWRRTSTDPNAAAGPSLSRLRDLARDLVRNNPYAASALSTIVDHVVGWGIVATAEHDAWRRWSESTDCDADGRNNLAGLEKLVMRTTVEAGECLVRRRFRRIEDGLALPMQLQVLEPDFLDTLKEGALPNGGRIIQGVEFDPLGRRSRYWVFENHPGARSLGSLGLRFGQSRPIPATNMIHVFRPDRPGQVRGPSWYAPVILAMKDFDELADATLLKQKVAACLAVITSNMDGTADLLGAADTSSPARPQLDFIEPGMILNRPLGGEVSVVNPPSVREYPDFAEVTLRGIATGLGVAYEDLTGDYGQMSFSAAKMSRLRHWDRVQDWRWRLLIPQFCEPVWTWAMEAAEAIGLPAIDGADNEWTAPPLAMVEPDREGLGYMRNIRAGLSTFSEAIRERGYTVDQFLSEYAADLKRLDALGIVLDSDARKMTQNGQAQAMMGGSGDEDDERLLSALVSLLRKPKSNGHDHPS